MASGCALDRTGFRIEIIAAAIEERDEVGIALIGRNGQRIELDFDMQTFNVFVGEMQKVALKLVEPDEVSRV